MNCGNPLVGLCVLVNFDRRRLEKDGFLTAAAALLALAALPSVLADAAASAVLAQAALPPVLAEAATAAVLAMVALPTVRTGGGRHSVSLGAHAQRPYFGAEGKHGTISSSKPLVSK